MALILLCMASQEGIAEDSGARSYSKTEHNEKSTRQIKKYEEFIINSLKNKTSGLLGFTGEIYQPLWKKITGILHEIIQNLEKEWTSTQCFMKST